MVRNAEPEPTVPILRIAYDVSQTYPVPAGIPNLNDVLPFRVAQVTHRDYRPAGDDVRVTVVPAWKAPTDGRACRSCGKRITRDPNRDGWITDDAEQFCTAYSVGVYEHEPREPERCPHTNPGIPSINHPETPTAPPWQCVHDAGHEGSHSPVHVCDKRPLVNGRPWPCVRALGHDGDCTPPTESRWLHKPLRECDREELIGAASLAFAQAEIAERDARDLNRYLLRDERRVSGIAAYALSHGKSPHGNNHKPFCWLKSAHCLAFAIIGSGGLDSAEADIARGRETT